ncbi:hypothetical protein PASE110613_15270 [Paenibacillus sediminis]|uniref:Uncharacterized protein n=1 Tax=Paenibacillus sediminis TaxID=664909 RepID=A0ABS4H449_9BACL|nr:hypothetical protein [Paenibacillus sediminis]
MRELNVFNLIVNESKKSTLYGKSIFTNVHSPAQHAHFRTFFAHS